MRSRIRSVSSWAAVGLAVGLALALGAGALPIAAAAAAVPARRAPQAPPPPAPRRATPPRPDARVAGLDAAVDADTAARLRELGHLR